MAIQTDQPQPKTHPSLKPTCQRIHITINNGRYTTSIQHTAPPSTTSCHAPTPTPDTGHKEDPVPASHNSRPCPLSTPALRLPHSCRRLITGDSKLKNVARTRIDSTGNTHARTFRGATVAQLTNIISTGACYPQFEQVAVAIGTNDCTGNMPRDIAADYQKLLSAIKDHFPTADVAEAAIPAQAKWPCNVRHDRRTQQRPGEPLCQQPGPLHAPLHALAVLSARKSRPWHPKARS